MTARERVLVAGGGIGGLATAVALAKVGVPSLVMERSAAFGEIGAGIQLGPNAFHAFDWLGVGEAARRMAVFIENMRLMDATSAEEIVRIPLGARFLERFGNPYAVVHRGDLYHVFLDACRASPLVELRAGADVVGHEQDGGSATAILSTGERVTGAALVGADGLLSKTRRQLLGDGAPRVSGHTTYRSVIPTERMPEALRWNAMTIWVGPKCHLVHYPLSDWKVFNLVVTSHDDAPQAVSGKSVTHAEMRRGFTHVHSKALQIIDHGSDWKLWVLCDRDPVRTWRNGRVVLLGDAAHPTLQYLAQGACMAMEDAVRLAHEVAASGRDYERAFAAYEAGRRDRTAAVTINSRRMGDVIFHPAGEAARRRDEILRSMSQEALYDEMAWLYGQTAFGPRHPAAADA